VDVVALTTLIRCLAPADRAVPLVELRRSLARHPRALVDEALCWLARQEDVHLWSEADQKRLTADDRAAALVLGGVPRHLLLITA
jgi:hypothetical protein